MTGPDDGAQPAPLRVRRLRPGARLPERQSEHASGLDLHASLDGVTLAIAVPPGIDAQVRPRSGLSARGVLAVLGTLDADYRGEVFVSMYCLPHAAPHEIRDGDRIAQLVLTRLASVEWHEVEVLEATARAEGGFGSTGRG
jgi:dUTP pyrophosphatase